MPPITRLCLLKEELIEIIKFSISEFCKDQPNDEFWNKVNTKLDKLYEDD